jgi:alcohol dehydrogenase (cytochrome c)/quinohemoprotein ethanol dehydrogenase
MLAPIALAALVCAAAAGAMPQASTHVAAITPAPAFSAGQEQTSAGDDWLTAGGGLNDSRHSTLTQVTSANVSGLKLAWTGTFGLPKAAAAVPQEGAALAYKGTLYIPDGLSAVMALDGATGQTLWYYSPKLDNAALLPAVRGLAIGDGKIYEGQTDGNLVALDQTTGNPIWKTKVGDPTDGIQFSSAPIYYNGMIFEGASGGDWGGRSFAVALDAKTGDELWRWYTAPSPGSLGSGTWGINEWQRGGGAIWIYPSIDVNSGLLYLVTGNPIPWNGRGPGNNLWTDSIVALHLSSGTFAWGFQTVHHDIWDFDVTNPPILFDLPYNGVNTPAIGAASKTGWVYILNRLTGKPILGITEKKVPQLKGAAARYANLSKTQPYVTGDTFTNQCSTKKQWPGKAADGKPYITGCIFTPYAYVKGQPSFLASAPSAEGGVDWQPSAYNPTTHDEYLCSINGAGTAIGAIPNAQKTIVPGALSLGVNFGAPSTNTPDLPQLVAMDMTNNKLAWRVTQPSPKNKKTPSERCSGVLSTDGGMVFAGQTNTKQLAAYDAATGKNLWLSSVLSQGPSGPPVTYTANGKQYIVVLAHGGVIFAFSL